MPTACVTRHEATDTLSVSLIAQPSTSEHYGKRTWRLLDERAAVTASLRETPMDITKEPAPREQPPRPDTNVDADLYYKLKMTLEVIFVSVWVEFIIQYQFNKLDNRMLNLEKGQTVTKTADKTAMALEGEMSMDANLIIKFITQQVSVAMDEKSRKYEKKI